MVRPNTLTEKKVQDKALEWAKKRRVPVIRLAMMKGAAAGWPDVIFLIPGGSPVFIEFKAPGKKPTAKQVHRHGQLREGGYEVRVYDDGDAACAFLQEKLDEAHKWIHG